MPMVGACTDLVQEARFLEHQLGRPVSPSLHLVTAEAVDRLGREPEMAHDRNLGVQQRLDHGAPLPTTLELDTAHPRLLDEA